MRYLRIGIIGTIIGTIIDLSFGQAWALPLNPRPELASYSADYHLSLFSARPDSGVMGADGWMTVRVEKKCSGWGTNDNFYLSVSTVDQPDHIIATKSTSFESHSGQIFRFKLDHWREDGQGENLSGQAILDKNFKGSVTFKQPKPEQIKLDEATLFPTRFMRNLLNAAQDNNNFYQAKIFDGSSRDNGMIATVSIGDGMKSPIPWSNQEAKSSKIPDSDVTTAWPISMAVFAPDSESVLPVYQVMILLRDNGISEEMRMDFGGFIVKATLGRLEKIPHKSSLKCP